MKRSRKLLAAIALAIACAPTGCYGSFAVTKELWQKNRRVEGRAGREAVFLALVLIPVYECALLADMLIFNTIELFSGENPLGDHHDEDDDGTAP